MVTWYGDGTMAGYDPLTKKLKKGLFHFATPGTVDLNGTTRLNYVLGKLLNTTTYPNNLQAQAPLTFSGADFTANPGKKLGVGLIIIRASQFPEGKIPTPQEIWNLPQSAYAWAQRATSYAFGPGPVSHTFELPTANGFDANTKWWVMLYPAAHTNANITWSKTNDIPIKGSNINSVARVMSFWSNRTPAAPVITSPLDGSIALPGAEFTLRLNPADPDEMAPEDAPKYNDDVNGVHFQYRDAPTTENPDPPWQDLPFDWTPTPSVVGSNRRDGAWHIRGSRYWNGLAGTPYHEALVANLGCPVMAGSGSGYSDRRPGKGALPTGNWQIRGRTFDYGHAYPNTGTKTTEPGPLGINHTTNWLIEPAKDTYPDANKSPWSEPVTITIPSQVPPPLAVSPKDAAAVSGNSDDGLVRLRWQYRNTHVPPREQFQRTVQIRKVGDPDWATVFTGDGSDPYVDLPWTVTGSSVPLLNLLDDGTFEGGTAEGWVSGDATTVLTPTDNAALAHSGSKFLNVHTNGVPPALEAVYAYPFKLIAPPPDEYVKFTFDGWVYAPPDEESFLFLQVYWWDEDFAPINPPINPDTGLADMEWPFFTTFYSGPSTSGSDAVLSGWMKLSEMVPSGADFDRLWVTRPPNASYMVVNFQPGSNITGGHMSDWRMDDWTITAEGINLDPFMIEVGNQYEWRVLVTDTDGIVSGFSTPARFWAVPAGASGETLPVPGDTIDGATLGCGTHHVVVYRRGGKERVAELSSISYVDWGRVRDDISTAQVKVSGWDIDCGNLLASLQTWAYELVIYRNNGFSVDRVWEGPITLLTYESDKVTIDAKDVMGYAYRRIIKQKMTDSGKGNGTTVVDRARRVIQNVFGPDDPNVLAYLQVLAREDDAMQYRSTPAYSRTAFEEVDDMAANAGLDYTAVGRAILLWGTKHRIGTLPELRDENLGASPIVSEYGMSMANVYSVSDGNGVHGEATRLVSGNDETYGLVEMLSSTWASDSEDETGTYTQAGLETVVKSFEGYAERSISDRYPPPVVVRIPDNTTLNPDTPISIKHLVPGMVMPLRSTSTLRVVAASQKLDSVKVIEEDGKETVSITVSPFSRDDTAVVEGEGE
jgi:hypothetical protein